MGGTAPAWLNAANEVVVDAFLHGAIAWTGISETLETILELHDGTPADSVGAVMDVDKRARAIAAELLDNLG